MPADRRRGLAVRARLELALDGAYADLTTLEALAGEPVVVVANHISALDTAFAMQIASDLGRKLWLAAAPVVLERHPWLRRFGLFAVERGAPLETTRALRALGRRLDGTPDGMVWFFPQGGHVRAGCDSTCERGALVVASAAPSARLVPVALHYELFTGVRPIGWARTDVPAPGLPGTSLDTLLNNAGNGLTADLIYGGGGYRRLLGRADRTVLLRNVPCERRRLAEASRGTASREELVDVVARREGPFYARLVSDFLTIT